MRRTSALRALIRETELAPRHLVAPLFVKEGVSEPIPIASMPGQSQHTLESLRKEAVEIASKGVIAFMLFGVPERKDAEGSEAWNPDGIAQKAIRILRDELGDDHVVIADLCLDEYTDHGHCGLLDEEGHVDNDATLERYRRIALAQAAAGAQMVGPSGMMDGQVEAIRDALDRGKFIHTRILAYSAKYASGLYGPFRDAVGSAKSLGRGTKHTYQMDYANSDEALWEVALDLEEGADMVMVKPGLPYLDVVRRVKEQFKAPTFVYQVSGEYSMLKAAAARGWLEERPCVMEMLTAFKRAGADGILTYYALDAAGWLKAGG